MLATKLKNSAEYPMRILIAVEASWMQKFEGSLTVQVQQSAVVDVSMKVGQGRVSPLLFKEGWRDATGWLQPLGVTQTQVEARTQ